MVTLGELIQRIGKRPGSPGEMTRMLTVIGKISEAEARENFETESFEGVPWKTKYPLQQEPFVNFAALVKELKERASPREGFVFDRRPLLRQTQTLFKSIGSMVSPNGEHVEVGADQSQAPYAPIHNFGSRRLGRPVVQKITRAMKKRLSAWLGDSKSLKRFRKSTEAEKAKKRGIAAARKDIKADRVRLRALLKGGGITKPDFKIQMDVLRVLSKDLKTQAEAIKAGAKSRVTAVKSKVGFLFGRDELVTWVGQRQFIGVTRRLERDIRDFVKLWLERDGKIRPPSEFKK